MRPKKLFHGMGFNELIQKIDDEPEQIYLFEISINKDSYNDNQIVISQQNKFIKNGLLFIYRSAIALTLIFFLNLITAKPKNMSDNNQNASSSTGNNNGQSSGGSNAGTSRQIPSTNSGQRSVIEKGGNPKGDILKKQVNKIAPIKGLFYLLAFSINASIFPTNSSPSISVKYDLPSVVCTVHPFPSGACCMQVIRLTFT